MNISKMFLFTLLATLLLVLVINCAESTVLHFNDLCNNNLNKSVIFTRLNRNRCICFDIGIYEHRVHSSPCIPTAFHVRYEQCLNIPSDTSAITRLATKNSNMSQVKFKKCGWIQRSKRVMRAAENGFTDDTDEEFSSNEMEIGDESMRAQMANYAGELIAKLTGLNGEADTGGDVGGIRRNYPVIKLLNYAKQIMQKTCAVVNPDVFDLALNAFINLQLETYHMKIPFIDYSAFKRIELALTRCLQKATSHIFVSQDDNNSGEFCDKNLATKSSDQIVVFSGSKDEKVISIKIPPYAKAEVEPGKIAEPLIEAVWKMHLSAHSYCYDFFSDYFNDHHIYTAALLPFFSNQIQDVWLNDADSMKGYNVANYQNTKLYGGFLGDILNVLKDIDYCVAASRATSAYPWFMNRPPKDTSSGWKRRRRRREAFGDSSNAQFVTGKVVIDDNVVMHKCEDIVKKIELCRKDF